MLSCRIAFLAAMLVIFVDDRGRAQWQPPLRADDLLRMSPAQLQQLYRLSPMVGIAPGKVRGTALLEPGTAGAARRARLARFAWQGKVFREDGDRAVNRFFGLRGVPADVYSGPSWFDGNPALILDYSRTSLVYRRFRDEIRQVGPGLYLGLMFDRSGPRPELTMYFALEPGR